MSRQTKRFWYRVVGYREMKEHYQLHYDSQTNRITATPVKDQKIASYFPPKFRTAKAAIAHMVHMQLVNDGKYVEFAVVTKDKYNGRVKKVKIEEVT